MSRPAWLLSFIQRDKEPGPYRPNTRQPGSVKEETEDDAPWNFNGLDSKSSGSACSRDRIGISIYRQVLQLTSYVRSTCSDPIADLDICICYHVEMCCAVSACKMQMQAFAVRQNGAC